MLNGYKRELDFIDKSAYVKIALNNGVDTLLDRIVIFVNGASYTNTNLGMIKDDTNYMVNATELRADTVLYDENGDFLDDHYKAVQEMLDRWISSNTVNSYVVISDYKYWTTETGTTYKRLVGKTYVRDVYGHFDAEDFAYGDISWMVSENTYNDDFVVEKVNYAYASRYPLGKDANGNVYLKYDTPLQDMPYVQARRILSAKDDRFMEIDINNTGLYMRSVSAINNDLYNSVGGGTSGMAETVMQPPQKIVFHDPYNILDFTAYGGTWAEANGGVRHNVNSDGTYSVTNIKDVLPNRAYATFADGTSDGSAGVEMYWDFNMLSMIPTENGTRGYIKGYVGEETYSKTATGDVTYIEAVVEGGLLVDGDSVVKMKEQPERNTQDKTLFALDKDNTTAQIVLPEIDPLTFDKEEYLASLPTKLVYTAKMRYEQDGSYQKFNIYGEETDYVLKRYVFNDVSWDIDESTISYDGTPTVVKLTYRFVPTADKNGTTLGSASEKVTVEVPVSVRNCVATDVTRLSAEEYLKLVYLKGSDSTGTAIAVINDKTVEGTVNLATVTEFSEITVEDFTANVKRFGSFTEFAGTMTGVTYRYDSVHDVLYAIYEGVSRDDFELYLAYYEENGVKTYSANNSDSIGSLSEGDTVYAVEGYVNDYVAALTEEDGKHIITVNPIYDTDIYSKLKSVKWIDITVDVTDRSNKPTGETDTIERWSVVSVDASEIQKIDFNATEHDLYTVYFIVKDSLGNEQEIPVSVKVLPKLIVKDNLAETITDRVLTPFDTRKTDSVALTYKKTADGVGTMTLGLFTEKDTTLLQYPDFTGMTGSAVTAWPTDIIKNYGTVAEYTGARSGITVYEDGNVTYIAVEGVSLNAFRTYKNKLEDQGTITVVSEDRLENFSSIASGTGVYVARGSLNVFKLPTSIQIGYGTDADHVYHEMTIYEGKDFVWVADSADKLRYDYSAEGDSWTYTWTARIGSGVNMQELTVDYTVNKRVPKNVEQITVYPYSAYYVNGAQVKDNACELSDMQNVTFADGNKVSTKVYFRMDGESWAGKIDGTRVVIDGIEYMTDVKFVDPSFDGSWYFADVLLYDDVFGSCLIKNVRIVMTRSTISSLVIPAPENAIYVYDADNGIEAYLAQEGIKAKIHQIANNTIGTDAFEIVSWRYVDEDGFKDSYTYVGDDVPQIKVLIGNKGYKAGKHIWTQEVTVTLDQKVLPAKVIDKVNDVTAEMLNGYILENANGVYTLSIADPFKFEMPETLSVTFEDGTTGIVPVSFDFGDNAVDFYKATDGISGTMTLGTMPNNKVTLDVTYVNKNPRTQIEVTYYKDADGKEVFDTFEYNAFDSITLPKYAKFTVNGTLEKNVYDVIWDSVEAYTTAGGKVKATSLIGDPVFGYLTKVVELTIHAESIFDYELPSSVNVNPYNMSALGTLLGITGDMLPVTTVVNGVRYQKDLSVKYPEIHVDYRKTTTHLTNIEVGVTNDFGGVNKIVDSRGNVIGTSLEIRQELPVTVVVESRVAVGVKTWFTTESTNITGSIYEPIDFETLGRATVIAIGKGKNTAAKLLSGKATLAEALATATKCEESVWPAEIKNWSEVADSAKANGQIEAVYYSETERTYYVCYRGDVDLGLVESALIKAGAEATTGADCISYFSEGNVMIQAKAFEEGVTVLFENAEEEKYDIEWDTSSLNYTYAGGTYTVKATLMKGDPELEQTFYVKVYVKPASLVSIGVTADGVSSDSIVRTDANGIITELVVDPYIGFVGLPTKVMARFNGYTSPIEINVSWNYAKILADMTTDGGSYNASNNRAAIAYVYVEGENGTRTAVQSIEVPVRVLNRSLNGLLFSKFSSHEAYKSAIDAGYKGSEFVTYSSEMFFNPYTDKYSEDFASEDFAYFRRVMLLVERVDEDNVSGNIISEAYKELVFELTEDSYSIRDISTNRATNLTNLYTGRKIDVQITFGATGTTVASDTKYKRGIVTTIYNMTYASGIEEVENGYTVDPYGLKDENGNALPMDVSKFESANPAEIVTVSGKKISMQVSYDLKDAYPYDEDGNTVITAKGGERTIRATFGNDLGGYQTLIIRVKYVNREISSLFDVDDTAFAYVVDKVTRFELDPYALYEKDKIYPLQSSNVCFAKDDKLTASYGYSESNISVTWDDSRVKLSYRGSETGYVRATIVSKNGVYEQTLQYKVIVLDRSVTSFDNVLADPNAKINPYVYSFEDDVSAAITKDLFRDGEFEVVFGNMSRDPLTGEELGLNEEDGMYYYYEQDGTLGTRQVTVTFTLGDSAEHNTLTQQDTFVYALASEEKTLSMRFVLDSARGLGHKGKDARFYITIPGFALGTKGEQLAPFDVACEQSYIMAVRFYNSNAQNANPDDPASYTLTYMEWLELEDRNAVVDSAIYSDWYRYGDYHYDTYYVDSPYYFISKGGIPLPEKALVYVGALYDEDGNYRFVNENGDADMIARYSTSNASYSFLTDTVWNNIVDNKTRIKYNVEDHTSSFQLDLDGQTYTFRFGISQQWILEDEVILSESYAYAEEEVILMPGQSSVKNGDILTISSEGNATIPGSNVGTNDQYTITFEGGTFEFNGVSGGGTYNNNYSKWNFDTVNWSADRRTVQYATMTLGGKGGQTVKWAFYVNKDKKLVNNTVASLHSMQVGESVTLETSYKQLFTGSTLSQSRSIPISYSKDIKRYYASSVVDGVETYPLGIERSGSGNEIRVTALQHTPSEHYQDDGSAYTGYIEWNATEYRAYPTPSEKIGGQIVFCVYRNPQTDDTDEVKDENAGSGPYDNLTSFGAYIHNPDAMYGFNELRPLLPEGWEYPTSMSDSGFSTRNETSVLMPTDATAYRVQYQSTTNKFKQNDTPVIKVASGEMFSLRYLPMVSVKEYRPTVTIKDASFGITFSTKTIEGFEYDLMYLIPWDKAKVYYTNQKDDPSKWNPANNVYGRLESEGYSAISTESSKINGRYTLVCDMPFGGTTITIVCAIDIV